MIYPKCDTMLLSLFFVSVSVLGLLIFGVGFGIEFCVFLVGFGSWVDFREGFGLRFGLILGFGSGF